MEILRGNSSHLDHRKNHRKTTGKPQENGDFHVEWICSMGFHGKILTEKKPIEKPWKNPWFPVKMLPPPWISGPKMSHRYG
jgi:hypothetical protein